MFYWFMVIGQYGAGIFLLALLAAITAMSPLCLVYGHDVVNEAPTSVATLLFLAGFIPTGTWLFRRLIADPRR